MKKNTNAQSKPESKNAEPEVAATPVETPPSTVGPVLTPDLIAAVRAAGSLDDSVKLLQPDSRPRAKADVTYTLNAACTEPLPQKRGACLKVIAAAVRLDRPFKVTDIAAQLPDVRSAPYWTRRLAKTGHLVEVTE